MIVYGLYLNNEWDGRVGIYTDKVAAERQAKLNRTSEKRYEVRKMDIILNSPSNKFDNIKNDIQKNTMRILEILKYRINKSAKDERSYSELRRLWFYLLPDDFTTHEAWVLARKLDIGKRTMYDWFSQSITADSPTLYKMRRGIYHKTREVGEEVGKMLSSICMILSEDMNAFGKFKEGNV